MNRTTKLLININRLDISSIDRLKAKYELKGRLDVLKDEVEWLKSLRDDELVGKIFNKSITISQRLSQIQKEIKEQEK